MSAMGLWMFLAVAALMVATNLPSWWVLLAVSVAFAGIGLASGELTLSVLSLLPGSLQGLFDNDLIQALPLYVFMGAMLNRLPLADILFRTGQVLLARTGASGALAGLGLGTLMAPMNGSVGSGVSMLSRTMLPRLIAHGAPKARAAALVCVASTLGVVIPPSLVLVLLGDAMMRAHTEATNVSGLVGRIINNQDIYVATLLPALLLLVLVLVWALAWWLNRGKQRGPAGNIPQAPALTRGECVTALGTVVVIVGLLGSVIVGRLYAVEAAAAGGLLFFRYGLITRTLTREVMGHILRDTQVISGSLFALLVAATTFTMMLRLYDADRWIANALAQLGPDPNLRLVVVLGLLTLSALVLDAFEIIFVVVPVVMPPLLTVFPDATLAAVLTLLMLQTSFLMPPLGYAILLVRQHQPGLSLGQMVRALLPYLGAQWLVLALVILFPQWLIRAA